MSKLSEMKSELASLKRRNVDKWMILAEGEKKLEKEREEANEEQAVCDLKESWYDKIKDTR